MEDFKDNVAIRAAWNEAHTILEKLSERQAREFIHSLMRSRPDIFKDVPPAPKQVVLTTV